MPPNTPDKREEETSLERLERMRTIAVIARTIESGGIKVAPGRTWTLHYQDSAEKDSILERVLRGELKPEEVDISRIKPDGITYDIGETEETGLDGLIGRIREQVRIAENYDYQGLLEFLHGLSGRDIDLQTAKRFFDDVARTRVQKQLIDSLGPTGVAQMKKALRKGLSEHTEQKGNIQQLLDKLKQEWARKLLREQAPQTEEPQTEGLAQKLRESFLEYVEKGDKNARRKLAETFRDNTEEIQKQAEEDRTNEFIDDLLENPENFPPEMQQQLQEVFNDFEPPQGDTPPPMQDSFSPSMDEMKESKEQQDTQALYTIEPPLRGYFRGQSYGKFNKQALRWEEKPILTRANDENPPQTHTISGKIGGNQTIPLPLPQGYSPALSSIPQGLTLLQDQRGCFYIQNTSGSTRNYTISFGKKGSPTPIPPQKNEQEEISQTQFSQATEKFLASIKSRSNTEKATAIINYMKNVLKLEYSNDSSFNITYKRNPAQYFSEIEKHKKVDCDVAQTYFIALCRKAGVPSRMITGHMIESATNGKSVIHGGTGHAWSEIWDTASRMWKTIDATPEKDDKKNRDQSQRQKEGQEEKPDIESPPQKPRDEMSPEEVEKKVEDQLEKMEDKQQEGSPSENLDQETKEKLQQLQDQSEQKEKSSEDMQDSEWEEAEKEAQEAQEKYEKTMEKQREMQKKIQEAETFKDLKDIQDEIENGDFPEDIKEQLEDQLEAKKEQKKDELKEKIEEMSDDGFISEEQKEKLLAELEKEAAEMMDRIEAELERQNTLYSEYLEIREEVQPLVEQWFKYFAERLPKIETIEEDEGNLSRRGALNRRAMQKARNLLFGTVYNPRTLKLSTEPRYMASLVLDISGSMEGRIRQARKLLIFFSELFSRISEAYGYIKFSIQVFNTGVKTIKKFDQDYDSTERYAHEDGTESTVKVRLMEQTVASGGTNMGQAIWDANRALNEAKLEHPNYLSALYAISDGDTQGSLSGESLRQFLDGQKEYWGEEWGEHMKCGALIGDKSQKSTIAQYFGEDDTIVEPDLDTIIERIMERFDEDITMFIDRLET